MNTEEKRAVLEAAGWVLHKPGQVKFVLRTYVFVPPSQVNKDWLEMSGEVSTRSLEDCITIAYRKFLWGYDK